MWYVLSYGQTGWKIEFVVEPRHRDFKFMTGYKTREEAYDAMLVAYADSEDGAD